jgi:hypothetical protein
MSGIADAPKPGVTVARGHVELLRTAEPVFPGVAAMAVGAAKHDRPARMHGRLFGGGVAGQTAATLVEGRSRVLVFRCVSREHAGGGIVARDRMRFFSAVAHGACEQQQQQQQQGEEMTDVSHG